MNGTLVKSWMKKQKMRPEGLAVKLDISLSTAKNIMNGKKPYRHTITVLAGLMGVPEQELMSQPKQKPESQKTFRT